MTTTGKELKYELGKNLKNIKPVTQYDLYKGVTDFSKVEQFNQYESGYNFLFVCNIPEYLSKLGTKSTYYKNLIDNYIHILENEFKGIDGLEDITTDTLEISDGINNINLISKVNRQSASTVNMRYTEKSGSILTKANKLYLTGLKDPATQIKTYHGLISTGDIIDPGPEYEVFTFLYIVTDNTARNLEQAYLLVAGQPTKAELSIYNGEKGSIENKELGMEFNCIPLQGEQIDFYASKIISEMNKVGSQYYREFNSAQYKYKGVEELVNNLPKSE